MKVVLDTDIGTDIDDLLALTVMLNSPELDFWGITCVYGDVQIRAMIALRVLQLKQRTIPVFHGARKPLLGLQPVYWEGHEGVGILDENVILPDAESQFAPDYLVQIINQYPKEIHAICIGPLTNLALALKKDPSISEKVASVTIMGGVVRGNLNLSLPIAEHNILCDPHAAHVVFSSRMPITLVPLNVTVKSRITGDALKKLQDQNTVFHDILADQIVRYPRFRQYGYTSPHDPLAVAALLRPDLVETVLVDVMVETSGRISTGVIHATLNPAGHVKLVTDVAVDTFEAFLLARLIG